MRTGRQLLRYKDTAKRKRSAASFFPQHLVQAKLQVNQPGDIYEQQADATAEHIMNGHGSLGDNATFFKPAVNNPAPDRHAGDGLDNYINKLGSAGQAMPEDSRRFFEPRFGYDFSNVRIHTGAEAAKSAQSVNALAYATGNHIVFNEGQYSPGNDSGKKLLAHELTHIVQKGDQNTVKRKSPVNQGAEAILNFRDDWKNYFFQYGKLITIGAVSFNQQQKENIKGIKNGNVIDIVLGEGFFTQQDEMVRSGWIKAEIIVKYSGADNFEDVAYDPTHSKLQEINPPDMLGHYCALNCPATAAALDQYLRTGKVTQAYCDQMQEGAGGYGFDISKNTFTKPMKWGKAEADIRKQLKTHGSFVVVEATRSQEQMKAQNLAENHYFIVVNVKGKLFAVDAFGGGIVNDDLQGYIDKNIIATTYRMVIGEFKVSPVISK